MTFTHPRMTPLNGFKKNQHDPLTPENKRTMVIRAMLAFDMIRRCDNWIAQQPLPDVNRPQNYFDKTLKIQQIHDPDHLDTAFEGYVVDNYNQYIWYHSS
jgi:hypothetical protein